MNTSPAWTNYERKTKRYKYKQKRKKKYNGSNSQGNTNLIGKRTEAQNGEKINYTPTNISTDNPLSLLETLNSLAQKIDLGSVRHHITEINQIVEQVNGVLEQFNRMNVAPRYPQQSASLPYYPPYPYPMPYTYYLPYTRGNRIYR